MRYTLKDFQAQYPTDEACLDKVMAMKFGGTELSCPGCGVAGAKFHRLTNRRAYSCQECGHHIYPCAGTIFEKSRTDLTKWFYAMYLFTTTRHGVPAKELERQLGVTYKCAWRMAHELRKLMATADHQGPLGGHVEIDETFVGGHQSKHARRTKGDNKTTVMGIVERGGNLRAGPIPNTTREVLEPTVIRNVEAYSIISTDEWRAYNDLHRAGYEHGTVNHHAKEYVRGIHHTNTIEGHWSLLKRSISGTHVHVSAKHLWKYVSEFSFRRNNRADQAVMFSRLLSAVSLPRLIET